MTRWRVACCLVVALSVATLAGCTSSGPADSAPASESASPLTSAPEAGGVSTAVPREPLRFNDPVPEPKDASVIEACDLLTDDQVVQLGLIPESADQQGSGKIQDCLWTSAMYPSSTVVVLKNIETGVPILDGMDLIRESTYLYEKLEVAGHPAVRGEASDSGTCTITVAVADYQGVGFKADQPESDPCSTSIRMAEFVLSNLPPLIEE